MAEPTPIKYIDLRLDDSKTEAEITAPIADAENKIMIPNDVRGVAYVLDKNGVISRLIKNNDSATDDPTVDDDTADGYSVGSRWYNSDKELWYRCYDATASAAVWRIDSDILLYANTSGSTAATFTDDLTFPDGTYLNLDNAGDGESYSISIEISAFSQVTNAVIGMWTGKLLCVNSSSIGGTEWGAITEVNVQNGTPVTLNMPTVSLFTGDIKIEVSHTSSSATSTDVNWKAIVTGFKMTGEYTS